MNGKKITLRDMAIAQNREKLLHNQSIEVAERFLLVIGCENSVPGKTSLINQVLQIEKAANESSSTYLLEYKYGRQSGKNLVKDVCHIWELGSGTTFISLLNVIVKPKQPTAVVLALDLTSPGTILKTTETLLNALKLLLSESSTNEGPLSTYSNVVEYQPLLHPFPIPLVIIGGKYDVFQNLEPAKKRIICQYLRCLAHILQADLLFYSKDDSKLVKNARDVLLQYAFGISVKAMIKVNFEKEINKLKTMFDEEIKEEV